MGFAAPLKMNKKTIITLGLLVLTIRAQALPALFKTTYRFELKGSQSQAASTILEEHLFSGGKTPALLSFEKGEKIFLMGEPSVDRCGVIHFFGNQVALESRNDFKGEEVRFYEKPLVLDIYCVPEPFPRCGSFRSSDLKTVGAYVEEQLKLFGAQCEALFHDSSKNLETYEIRSVSNLAD